MDVADGGTMNFVAFWIISEDSLLCNKKTVNEYRGFFHIVLNLMLEHYNQQIVFCLSIPFFPIQRFIDLPPELRTFFL